jgi:hypothetical protein
MDSAWDMRTYYHNSFSCPSSSTIDGDDSSCFKAFSSQQNPPDSAESERQGYDVALGFHPIQQYEGLRLNFSTAEGEFLASVMYLQR